MGFTVTRQSESLVKPSKPTPSEILELSAIDRNPGLRHQVRSLHVFKHGQKPSKVIGDALAKALVPYYPLAGRFAVSDQGEVVIECAGQGAWFVEATANCSLEDVKYFDHPLLISEDELLPNPRVEGEVLDVPFMMQERYDIPEEGKKWSLDTVNCAWRRWKCNLKKKCFDGFKNDKQRKKMRPESVPEPQFNALLNFWKSERAKTISENNRANRDGQEYTHTTGSTSFARIRKRMEKELGRHPTEAEVFIETRKKKKKPQEEKTIQMIGTLEELKDQFDDPWDMVKKDEHPGRVRLRGRGVTQTMLQNKGKKIVNPYDCVPESVVQTISQKVEKDMMEKFEAQKVELLQGFAELLTDTIGQTIDPSAIARLIARTRCAEEANSAPEDVRGRSSRNSHNPDHEENI